MLVVPRASVEISPGRHIVVEVLWVVDVEVVEVDVVLVVVVVDVVDVVVLVEVLVVVDVEVVVEVLVEVVVVTTPSPTTQESKWLILPRSLT